jgi:hypothetical protein
MARKKWTPAIDAHVDRRIGEGATYAVIAGELGITAAALAGRLFRRQRSEDDPARGQPRAAGALRTLEESLGYQRVVQDGCRWVIGEPPGVWRWCGNPIAEGPYCAEHARLSKNPRGERS